MRTGAYILGCAGPVLGRDEAAFFRDADPWGFILFTRNLEERDQILRLTGALRDAVGRDAPILIDQEGGRVQRMHPPLVRDWLPPLDQAAQAGQGAARAMVLRCTIIADELRALGIDVNCVPCADIAGADTHPFLRNRCHGTDAASVTEIARAAAEGTMAGGALPVMKHMLGHGRATQDSHLDLPVVDADPEMLMAEDFAPFRALSDLPLGMTGHIRFTAYDPEAPTTISPRMIRLIRDEIGFEGLLMTDDLSMEALPGTIGARSKAAIGAGCDAILHCNGKRDEMEAVASEAGRMSGAAEARADRALALRKPPAPIDIAGLEAEFEALLAGGADERDE